MKKERALAGSYCLILLVSLLAVCLGSRTATAMAESSPLRRKNTIIIDPGHGGVDGGATSCTGKPESAFNLEIALRLEDMLHLLGHSTEMIRREDISVYTKGETIAQKKLSDLRQRVTIANGTPGALLVSIHQNTFSDSRYSGPQVFYGNSQNSEALAGAMQAALTAHLSPESSRAAKKAAGIYLLEQIRVPGILIECGFLSNAREEARLRDPEYQKKLSAVIAATVTEYLSNT